MSTEGTVEVITRPGRDNKITPKRVARRSSGYALGFKPITRRSRVRILAPLYYKRDTTAYPSRCPFLFYERSLPPRAGCGITAFTDDELQEDRANFLGVLL